MDSREAESQYKPRNRQSPQYVSSDHGLQQRHMHTETSEMQFCTLESSSFEPANYDIHQFSSAASTSLTCGSPIAHQDCPPDNYGSPLSTSCVTGDPNDFQHRLREIETAMLDDDSDMIDRYDINCPNNSSLEPDPRRQTLGLGRRDLKQVLIACARAVAENDQHRLKWLIPEAKQMVSISGDPIQRLGAYVIEALIARLRSSGSVIYGTSKCKEPQGSDLLTYMNKLYELCPYMKFGYLSGNGAIAEAVKDEKTVHIIDFQIAQGSQWITFIHAFAERSGGPPFIRITGIDDPNSKFARGAGLDKVGSRLQHLADLDHVPFEFHAVPVFGKDVELEHLDIHPGEAVVVNFPYQLHHLPDETVSTRNDRDRVLRLVKSLSPKVVTLVEQECNTNTAPFFPRFLEVLDFYEAMFESIDGTVGRDNKERMNVEQHCIATDIVNVLACEGDERVERHEPYGKWRSRFTMAGFRPYPLSSVVNEAIKELLGSYSKHYKLEERDGVLYLGWKNRTLVVCSAWQ